MLFQLRLKDRKRNLPFFATQMREVREWETGF